MSPLILNESGARGLIMQCDVEAGDFRKAVWRGVVAGAIALGRGARFGEAARCGIACDGSVERRRSGGVAIRQYRRIAPLRYVMHGLPTWRGELQHAAQTARVERAALDPVGGDVGDLGGHSQCLNVGNDARGGIERARQRAQHAAKIRGNRLPAGDFVHVGERFAGVQERRARRGDCLEYVEHRVVGFDGSARHRPHDDLIRQWHRREVRCRR
ncbi:hypothetical protein FKQ53_01735 [Pandoraea pnomenusa]|nr:hypothetical protein FKQ53_01735 [Pandoraea pnomenusa]